MTTAVVAAVPTGRDTVTASSVPTVAAVVGAALLLSVLDDDDDDGDDEGDDVDAAATGVDAGRCCVVGTLVVAAVLAGALAVAGGLFGNGKGPAGKLAPMPFTGMDCGGRGGGGRKLAGKKPVEGG